MTCGKIKVTIELTEQEIESLAHARDLVYDKRIENYKNGLNKEDDEAFKLMCKIYGTAYGISKMQMRLL